MKTSIQLKAEIAKLEGKHKQQYVLMLRTGRRLDLIDKEIKRLHKRLKSVRKIERDNSARYEPLGEKKGGE